MWKDTWCLMIPKSLKTTQMLHQMWESPCCITCLHAWTTILMSYLTFTILKLCVCWVHNHLAYPCQFMLTCSWCSWIWMSTHLFFPIGSQLQSFPRVNWTSSSTNIIRRMVSFTSQDGKKKSFETMFNLFPIFQIAFL